MSQRDTLTLVIEEVALALAPLQTGLSSPERFVGFMAQLGWSVDDIPQPLRDLGGGLSSLFNQLQGIVEREQAGETISLSEINDLRVAVQDVFGGIQAIRSAPDGAFPPSLLADNFKSEFPSQLVQFLIVKHLTRNHPQVAYILRALGVVRIDYQLPQGNRRGFMRHRFELSGLADVLEDPALVFRNAFGWGTDEPDFETLFHHLENLFISHGVEVTRPDLDRGTLGALTGQDVEPREPLRRPVAAVFFERVRPEGRLAAELLFTDLPGDGALKPGLAILPRFNGPLDFRLQLGTNIAVTISSTLDVQGGVGLILRPGRDLDVLLGFEDGGAPTSARGGITVRAEYSDETQEPVILIGSPEASRLEFQNISGTAGLSLDLKDDSQDLFVEFELQGGKIVIAPGQGDGFLQAILPGGGISAALGLVVGVSLARGFYFAGSGGLEIRIPSHVSLGPVKLEALTIGANPKDGTIPVTLGATLQARLGPLTAVVENMGLRATFSFPDGGGNIGPLDLGIGFKPPIGLGLSIDGGGFKGGGFIRFEPEEARYSGMLELEFQDQFSLKAFALLNTRLPNGQSGFSLLIVISSEFTPIQLGFGFKLNGVGGLLGLNRTVQIEPLRAGLRDNTLGSILFPTDIIANADRILSDLRQVFPPQEGRFIFGPMAKITWGTPTLITIDLGLVIEIPEPIRLVILGILRAILPDERASILRLQVNFLGEINFERQQLSFDASLFDSKLLAFTLTGDMAIRLNWGADANFLLTVGGFHPAYQPPPMNLPSIRRLTLSLLSGDNPRLTLEMYFAVTSNTVQFGAHLELYASAWKFNVCGFLTFDVLFQFSPFYFIAEITAMVTLKVGSSSIASIKLTLTLEGPTPWKAKGTASFKVCWFFTLKVRFNKTFGEERNITLPDLAVLPLLIQALSAADNWEAEHSARKHRLESFREANDPDSDELLVHPVGVLKISQKVVPLNLRIDRMGAQRPSDANEFHITDVVLQTSSFPNPPFARESFAPAQFFDMTDDEKLASPSFKNFDSGIRIGEPDRLQTAYAAARDVQYELKYIDSQRNQRLSGPRGLVNVDVVSFNSWTLQGAISKSELSFARTRKSHLAPEAVAVVQEPFAIVNTGDLKLFDELSLLGSERAAFARVSELIETNPALRGAIQVVPAFELSA